MAATIATCACGRTFVAQRSHAAWCSDRCRKAAKRAGSTWPRDFERGEAALIEQVRQGREHPADALLRIVSAWPTPQLEAAA